MGEGNTFAAVRGKEERTSRKRGVAPLLALIEQGKTLDGFMVADKVVGAAAAYLYALLRPVHVHALVVSEKAIAVLKRLGVAYSFGDAVPAIKNRAGDGFCPMEQAVVDCETPQQALQAVLNKRDELAKQ